MTTSAPIERIKFLQSSQLTISLQREDKPRSFSKPYHRGVQTQHYHQIYNVSVSRQPRKINNIPIRHSVKAVASSFKRTFAYSKGFGLLRFVELDDQ